MKNQPADNKASEARRVGGPCSITQSFYWKPDAFGFILFNARLYASHTWSTLRRRRCIYFVSFPWFFNIYNERVFHLISSFARATVQFVRNVPVWGDTVAADWHGLPRRLSTAVTLLTGPFETCTWRGVGGTTNTPRPQTIPRSCGSVVGLLKPLLNTPGAPGKRISLLRPVFHASPGWKFKQSFFKTNTPDSNVTTRATAAELFKSYKWPSPE